MRFVKKPLSLLLSLLMIFSLFTIIPVTTASAESVTVYADKWVSAENVIGKYYRFSDLYANVIFVRADPNVTPFGYSLNDNQGGTWNHSGDLTLDDNKFTVNSWSDGYGHSLGGNWGNDSEHNNDGYIYLSDELNSDTADWYAYTWETFTGAEHVAAAAPDCTNAGNFEYYQKGSRYFVPIDGTTDGNQNVEQVPYEDTVDAALGHSLIEHPAVDPASTTAGNSAYWECERCHKYFSDAEGTNEIAENSWIIPPTATFITGHNLSLADEIAVKYYIYVPDGVSITSVTYSYGTGAYRKVDISAEPKAVTNPAEFAGANYMVPALVNARSMTDTITLTVNLSEGDPLVHEYRVIDYVDRLATQNSAYQPLLVAMLNYGAACQSYFEYREDALASDYINAEWNIGDNVAEPEDYPIDLSAGEGFGYTYKGAVLTATSQTKIRLFFEKNDDLAKDVTITFGGQEVTPYMDGTTYGYYCIELTGISAKNIFDDYQLIFSNSDESAIVIYNAKNYYNKAMASNKQTFKTVMEKLYIYSVKAKAKLQG